MLKDISDIIACATTQAEFTKYSYGYYWQIIINMLMSLDGLFHVSGISSSRRPELTQQKDLVSNLENI